MHRGSTVASKVTVNQASLPSAAQSLSDHTRLETCGLAVGRLYNSLFALRHDYAFYFVQETPLTLYALSTHSGL